MNRVEHKLGLKTGEVRVIVQPPLSGEVSSACAFIFGDPGDGCLVRIHSRCLYGDVFGSTECDCGPQLQRSIELIRTAGSGLVIYLEQEGRGAGLLAKAMAYRYCEDRGADTFAAYAAMHLPPDCRSYDAAAMLIRQLGIQHVTLLTNNPEKVEGLRRQEIAVTRKSLRVPVSGAAARYLESKRQHGHMLTPTDGIPMAAVPRGRGRHRLSPVRIINRAFLRGVGLRATLLMKRR
jgi:GTP cyclohydrolase II